MVFLTVAKSDALVASKKVEKMEKYWADVLESFLADVWAVLKVTIVAESLVVSTVRISVDVLAVVSALGWGALQAALMAEKLDTDLADKKAFLSVKYMAEW